MFRDPSKLRFTSSRQSLNKYVAYLTRILDYRFGLDKEQKQIFEKVFWPKNVLQRTLWSFQDLRDGGGVGFAIEFFLLSLKQLLSTSPSQEPYSALYTIAFRAITHDRRKCKHSVGTQKLLLDAVASDQGFLRTFNYPDYITDDLWELLGDMLEGQTGPHVDSAVEQLMDLQRKVGGRYGAKASAVVSRAHM